MTVDLARVTRDTFAPHVGSRFALALSDGVLEFELCAVAALPAAKTAPRAPFALRFCTPSVIGHLPQCIYPLEHPVLGTLEVFLVPLGPGATGMRYEAIFA
jgi:hypothetical protein